MPNVTYADVSRFPDGVSTTSESDIFASLPQSDPTKLHTVWDDFDTYTAGNWVVTNTGAATEALTAGDGGLILLTNSAGDDDVCSLQSLVANFAMASGKKAWFKSRLKVSDATQIDFMVGLVIVDTSPFASAPTDGIYFRKDDGDTNLDFSVRKDATTGNNEATAIATVVADTYMELAWYYDGVSKVFYAVDGVVKGSLDASSTYLPDAANLAVTIALQNGEAVAKTMTVDYVFASKAR
jgi:hypothetical protein